jgi:hypothetical protein
VTQRAAELAPVLAHWPVCPVSITPHGGGLINASWRVDTATGPFLLQRLNPQVFADGAGVMRNIALVTAHLAQGLERDGTPDRDRRALRLVPTASGQHAVQADDDAWWRLLHFIEGSVVRESVATPAEAEEAGRAFGDFLARLADFDEAALTETIPAFRHTLRRVEALDRAVAGDGYNRVAPVRAELVQLDARRHYAGLIPPLIASGALPRRVVHNDAKSGNVLRDARSGAALAVIDLDTVMPGTALSDMGDLIRSMASPTAEDERDLDRIQVQPGLIAGLARGYLGTAGERLTLEERRLFVAAGLVTTFEQAVRFFTDYLDGDRYYQTTRPGQNLDRGRAQLRLLLELEKARSELEEIVRRL